MYATDMTSGGMIYYILLFMNIEAGVQAMLRSYL
jgi:hypothetical protein